jgi:predicted transcriptional regulator
MPKTKLEMYVDVLNILAQNNLHKTDDIADGLNISFKELKICLTFLLKQGLVDKRKVGNYIEDYLITQGGIRVLRYFNELKQGLPMRGEINRS